MGEGTWQVGSVRVTRVSESSMALPVRGLFPDVDAAAFEAHADWLKPHFLSDDGQIVLSIHALVVESHDRVIVVDTCVGDRSPPGFEGLSGEGNPFLDRMAAAGFAPTDVDIVLCTHLHFDHVGWNTRRDGDRWVPTFVNARYLFDRTEYAHWTSDVTSDFVGNLAESVRPVFDAGLADLVEPGHVIDDQVQLVSTPGHTPGHVSVRIESQGQVGFITGDMTHHPVQWAEPGWRMMADSDSDVAAQTRRAVGDRLLDDAALVIGTHYPEPTAGWLARKGGGLRFVLDRGDVDE